MTEKKKGNTVKIRDAYGNKHVADVADVRYLLRGSDSLHKVPKCVGLDKASNDFIIETSYSDTKESRQDQDPGL